MNEDLGMRLEMRMEDFQVVDEAKPDFGEMKCDINNFVFSRVPDKTTVVELDMIAHKILKVFEEVWDKWEAPDAD